MSRVIAKPVAQSRILYSWTIPGKSVPARASVCRWRWFLKKSYARQKILRSGVRFFQPRKIFLICKLWSLGKSLKIHLRNFDCYSIMYFFREVFFSVRPPSCCLMFHRINMNPTLHVRGCLVIQGPAWRSRYSQTLGGLYPLFALRISGLKTGESAVN